MQSEKNIKGMRVLIWVVGMVLLYSCASVGRLEGGDYDETPPVLLSANPPMGSLNNGNRKRITLEFDEYIKLDKPGEKIVFSPPQLQQPEIKTNGKKVIVNLEDTLKENTTYTIDFADAIQDNNEGNPLEQFTYTFSTGDQLDTLAVAGTILNAADLEPIKGVVVGLYSDLSDTVFKTKPFERMGRSDSRGYFSIRGIAPGKYRIFALQDADQNYYFNQPTEQVAFYDSLIIPTSERRMRVDTLWRDSITIDSLFEVEYTYYMPDDIVLRNFKQLRPNRRYSGASRPEAHKFVLNFTAPADSLPKLEGLNFDATDAFVTELHDGVNDTLTYWIKDSLLIKMDTLKVAVNYLYTDSLEQMSAKTDTINLVYKAKQPTEKELKAEEKRKKEEEKKRKLTGDTLAPPAPKKVFLPMEVYAPSSMDIYDYLSLTFQEPIVSVDTAALHLRQKVDTVFVDIPFDFMQDSIDKKVFNIFADFEAEGSYTLEVDSAAATGIYGYSTDKTKKDFKIKALVEYGQLFFTIAGVNGSAFVDLLDERDGVVRTVTVENGHADFYYLNPGKYCARLVEDRNGNGVWDTGDYDKLLQPETVYYFDKIIELKANFDINQNWDIHALTPDKQKPDSMKKQKPEQKRQNRRNNNASNQSGSSSSRGFGF